MSRSLFSFRIRNLPVPSTPLGTTLAMSSSSNNDNNHRRSADSRSNPRIQKLQQLVKTNASAGWEESWKQGVTPWDLGCPTPVILHLHHTGSLPIGRILVPGCGTGYDVVAMACPRRYVVGLDISEEAIKKAKQVFLCHRARDEISMGTANPKILKTRWRAYYIDVSAMKRCCIRWALRQYPLLIINWPLNSEREGRSLEDGKEL